MILHSKVTCVDKDEQNENERLGLDNPLEERSLRIAIDLKLVAVIRENESKSGNPTTTIYVGYEDITIDEPYNKVVNLWENSRNHQ